MKKLLLLITVMALVGTVSFSQSLKLSFEGNQLENGALVMYHGDPAEDEIVAALEVTNSASSTITVRVSREQISMIPDSWSQFCWLVCYAPDVSVSSFTIDIEAGQTVSDQFTAHYHPMENPGKSTVKYMFYDDNNPSDVAEVFIEFNASAAGISDELLANVVVSNVYPNPANQYANIDYSIPADLGQATLVVSNLLGAQVMQSIIQGSDGSLKLYTGDLENGMYFYTIKVEDKIVATKRMIINH